MLCGGDPFVPSDPKLKGGYFMSPCVLGMSNTLVNGGTAHSALFFNTQSLSTQITAETT